MRLLFKPSRERDVMMIDGRVLRAGEHVEVSVARGRELLGLYSALSEAPEPQPSPSAAKQKQKTGRAAARR